MLKITLKTHCYPTEDREKVVRALTNLFPDAVPEGDEEIAARSSSLETFGELLRRHRIRDAARVVMRRGLDGQATTFMVNKQVASIGKVSFSQESHALGDIEVRIESEDIYALIASVAPDTRGMRIR